MKIKGYICGTDWNTELPLGANDVKVYTDLKILKRDRTCYPECGIVQIEIIKKRTVQKGTNFKK